MSVTKAIIMAGGKGTRISSVASDIPKPMIKICGKPSLQYQIECLKKNGITDITLVTGHLAHFINEYFGDGSKFGVNITYFEETEPLGTAGALFKIPDLTEDFILLCGDIIFDIDFKRFIKFHEEHKALASLIAHPNGHPYDSSLIETETVYPEEHSGLMPYDTHKVIAWNNKEERGEVYKNRVNAGIEIISPELLQIEKSSLTKEKVDLDRDILKPNIPTGRIFAYDTTEYIKDMGTPDRYYQVEKDISSGLVERKNLSNKQKCVFLDRDGTLNKKSGFITKPDQIELIDGAADFVKTVNQSGALAVVVTNQPQIARGELTFEELNHINKKLETLLGNQGAYLDAVYFCPHHTDKGFAGERIEYKCNCNCRKPNPGMLLKAAEELNIDLSQSVMIGDSEADVQAGKNAGCKESILVGNGKMLKDLVLEEIF